MLIKCPECGKQISDKVEACPNCGAPQPASLRTAALEKRRVARRRTIRIVAIVLVVTALAASTTFAALYRWPVSYRVGTVTGTDTISRENLVKAVDDAAATWNSAAGRTVAWRLPLGRKVKFDVQIDASLLEYLTTLAGLEEDEAALLATKNGLAANAYSVRRRYDEHSAPYTQIPGEPLDWMALFLNGTKPTTLEDVKFYEQRVSTADVAWKKAYDRLQAFRKAAAYTGNFSDIDAGVSRTEGSPTTVVLTFLPNTYTLTAVVVHQFGHVLLGAWGANDSPPSVTAAPLKSPWKLHLFGRNSQ